MLKWLIRRGISAFERRWGYDATYMHEVAEKAGVGAMLPMNGLQKLGAYRRDIPKEAYYAAAIVASKAADCGPCLQLGISMADAAGVAPSVVRAALRDDREGLPESARLAYDLARSVVARDGSGEAARTEILRRYGHRALVSLAYAMVVANAYPTLKYALGYGHTCARVRVGGEDVTLEAAAAR